MAADPVADVVVAGASVGGLAAAEQLRTQGFTGPITLVGAEPHLPYDRPPLSKQVLLGTRTTADVTFRTHAELAALKVDLRLGVPATGWDGRELALADGSSVPAQRLIIATGVRARTLPGQPAHPAIGTLRTVDDAVWLAERLRRGGLIAIVGGGFIGAEVASAARSLGNDVVLFEATELPMQRVMGAAAARLFAEVLAEAGVRYRGGAAVGALEPDGDAIAIRLADGALRAATVVVGIGSVPQTGWLGIDTADGVRCDARGRAEEVPNAYAIGDVAAWPDVHGGAALRTEHWTNTRSQAAAVAADIVGGPARPAEPHYFWTDQFGLKIQVIGRPDRADDTVVLRPDDGGVRRSVVLYLRGDTLVGVALFSAARQLARSTALVRDGVDRATAMEALSA